MYCKRSKYCPVSNYPPPLKRKTKHVSTLSFHVCGNWNHVSVICMS